MMNTKIYDIAVVGGGAAGTMAAIRAAESKKCVILIERNTSIGRKILMTGKGRCNVTNAAGMDIFIEKFGKEGSFFRTAFSALSNKDLMDFFENRQLKLKIERQGRVFPATDKAHSITETLEGSLKNARVDILYNSTLSSLSKKNDIFELYLCDNKKIRAEKVILATGGLSYPETGSRGDGFRIARKLGHTIVPLRAALVPLKTEEMWVRKLQGLSLLNVRVIFLAEAKKIVSNIGEIMFTHFGVSGPLVLDLSGEISDIIAGGKAKVVKMFIDLKPALDEEKLESRLLREFRDHGTSQISKVLQNLLPKRMVPVFAQLCGLEDVKKTNQVTLKERHVIIRFLKAFPLTITGTLSIKRGMVTGGGVSTKEIDPRTMESRLIAGLYFAGEIIDGAAPSGGYNLQQAFSTGFLAGEKASTCEK